MSSRGGRILTVVLAAVALNACNVGPQTAGIDGSGVRSSIVAQGPIQGFGSVIVNGQHYAVTNAQISVDGRAASEADLAIGQYVTVSGSVDATGGNRIADSVEFDANVLGPVQAADAATGTLVVLRQPVTTTTQTVLDLGTAGAGLDALALGDFVAVSGFVAQDGSIKATWIKRSSSGQMQVIGTVSVLDPAHFRFQLNDLVVDYSAAATLNGFSSGAPANGDRVRVTGTMLQPNGMLTANEIDRIQSQFSEHEGEGAEIEGLITRFASATDFDVSGNPVTTTASTTYEGGSASSLQLNVQVQVQGTVNSSGILVAQKISVSTDN